MPRPGNNSSAADGRRQKEIAALLGEFDADALRAWIHGLGIDTFVGSSGRVFPSDMKAAPLLRAWLKRLREQGVLIHTRCRWLGWNADGTLDIQTAERLSIRADAVILALGGGSWQRLGSDGAWVALLRARGIEVEPCGQAIVVSRSTAGASCFATSSPALRSNRWPWDWRAKRRARANSS